MIKIERHFDGRGMRHIQEGNCVHWSDFCLKTPSYSFAVDVLLVYRNSLTLAKRLVFLAFRETKPLGRSRAKLQRGLSVPFSPWSCSIQTWWKNKLNSQKFSEGDVCNCVHVFIASQPFKLAAGIFQKLLSDFAVRSPNNHGEINVVFQIWFLKNGHFGAQLLRWK